MGAALPLPERIPYPNEETLRAMKADGINVHEKTSESKYVTYSLPPGWKMVDDSLRQDIPVYYILDEQDMRRYSVKGSWKEIHENELFLSKVSMPEKHVPRKELVKTNQTSAVALMKEYADVDDVLQIGKKKENYKC